MFLVVLDFVAFFSEYKKFDVISKKDRENMCVKDYIVSIITLIQRDVRIGLMIYRLLVRST